ncbi:MAG: tRNA isopentenyl-2-thiomethyl-A-37 hydroxylase MiaE, partial [Halieaceae bacterium]|nr:tRNA isopentenyl-2-thiomethyl-A-37 hydroxylase MiaE [Halieaceae bacterium]
MADAVDLQPVKTFLACPTPEAWVTMAARPEQLAVLLIDHANCEKKAAATAMSLMHRYVEQHTLLQKMSRLAREELRHFEQVTKMMKKRGVDYVP